ncbi:MAG TPA: RNA methyltransferase [Anaerolinea thermolimosa]|uniref:RNA methyltransferase n=1 Tax=Anaerolinea thermolimosa TaxID=229919 RepID=A0A3D1JJT4_9CHLR|nr:methyltransferase domain-containing protein [Anaerolinea thermolimosa]HCE18507.1 RNA methyltransferase [Anaerolinea thermolimosa]
MPMFPVFALTGYGLERIAAEEMSDIPGLQVEEVAYRRVCATCSGKLAPLLRLRTVDDVFLKLDVWDGLPPQRSGLQQLHQRSEQWNLHRMLKILARERTIEPANTFSVTVSFVGRRNYTAEEVKQAVAGGISRHYRWEYSADDEESAFNVRLFIEHEHVLVGVRVGARPLHRRAYKQVHLAGSLKPSVAAALLRFAGVKPGHVFLDAFCGAGTLAIEAAWLGAHCLGGDLSPEAIRAARANASLAGQTVEWCRLDATRLPFASRSVDRMVSNLPWGRQVAVDLRLEYLYRAACAEMERVLVLQGRVVLLTSLPELVAFERLRLIDRLEISLFGQRPAALLFGLA